ncbi:MAG: DNA mismatch repair endonuclease MutL [Planctomycetota bacterium]|jgi:DNA mismatch repair protein MutL|nr:DNA mismatch repair endonuclease MutL [Planctomycetota bacterium]
MAKIHRLPEIVQNKIAAGEVVERPASVVKELVENAIDAGAKSIQVDLEAGGHRLIRVTDDGGGMAPEDLELAVERHATSKITDVEDIFRISTLGFRGEALPSIASVSRLKIVSGLPGESLASSLTVEGGNSLGVAPAPPRPGTLVEVRDIFFNTPARRKFLKSPVSENAKAAEILTRLALAHPEIAFRLDLNHQISFSVQPVASQRERLRELFGQEKTAAVLDLKHQAEGITLTGLVAPPPESRANSAHIFILVNRRAIRHVGLVQVIRQGFQASLPPPREPCGVGNRGIVPEWEGGKVHPG